MKIKYKVIAIGLFVVGTLLLTACQTTKITPPESKIMQNSNSVQGEQTRTTTIKIGGCNE